MGMRLKPVRRMTESTSLSVASSRMAHMSTRGTMTSRAMVSPRSMTSWIIDFSSSESSSESVTMYLISSSETSWRSSVDFTCSMRAMPLALAEVSQISGLTACEKPRRKPATRLETPSASAMAMRLGTSSPTTIEKYDTIRVMSTVARPFAMLTSMPKLESHRPSGSERLVAANADEKNPTSVMATWMAARNCVGSSIMSAAVAALASPSSASWSSSTFRAVESAISDIEKYPFTRVSRNVTRIDKAMSMRECATSLDDAGAAAGRVAATAAVF